MGSVTTMDKKELTKLVSYFIMGDGGAYIIKKNAKFVMNMRAENSVIKSECLNPLIRDVI